ncbi:glycoside hydrolase family 88 protein [Lachnotalea sp. AF33-28]|uniref:glycoside hydrolase family 88 protein n=1 Tax=Lachnotalea sp. AF33-28 TaxID=2292046 RepID=UPI000E4B03F7|nr:glycoside hydrolase family 88 protein [Lachnotalea sp. AF33-28]RHP33516.1 rhamnogalacturonyl hydrolase [Lachnotalea sp. AF33-28]
MCDYFEQKDSVAQCIGTDVAPVLKTIAGHYIDSHPPKPPVYRPCSTLGFRCTDDYLLEIKLHDKFPDMKLESYAYAWGMLKVPAEGNYNFRFAAYGPVFVYVNGEYVYRSGLYEERFSTALTNMSLKLKEGENSILFLCVRTPLGCGCRVGAGSYKGMRIAFYSPTLEKKGMSGMIYSEPMDRPLEELPRLWQSEAEIPVRWYPRTEWNSDEKALTPIRRIYGGNSGLYLSASAFVCDGSADVTVTGRLKNCRRLWIDRVSVTPWEGDGSVAVSAGPGRHTLLVLAEDCKLNCGGASLECPVPLENTQHHLNWLYAGPFTPDADLDLDRVLSFKKPLPATGGDTFWRTDQPGCYLRIFNESVNFGEWSYPLGVTLYGMLQTARMTGSREMDAYITAHLEQSASHFEYCQWDKHAFGAASFHHLLTTLDSLDDCGSFGSMMLEYMKDHELADGRVIADYIAEYIRDRQQRLPDGTFYRNHSYIKIMDETMWADDMYMSIPFLCRYYQLSGDAAFLDDAARQVKNFKKYLYMPDLQIMSHIYDVHYGLQTKVPWGRGNGWVLFSTTELLAVLPEDHPDYPEILAFFREMCSGVLRLQGPEGMWRQVLTFPDSYKETSCTAMFLYAFSRGVRYGWLTDPALYREAVNKGWKALCGISVDKYGNVYGVCRGSGYSFSKEYYANDLSWRLNDTHGIGIVMLAGIETEKMNDMPGGSNH